MTRKMMLIAGVAGLALTAPVVAKPDRGGGGGGDRGGGRQAQQAPQQQRAERPQMQRQQRAERPQMQQRAERQQQRMQRPQRMERQQARQERPQFQRAERQIQRAERQQPRFERQQRQEVRRAERQQQPRFERQQRQEVRRAERQQQQRIERGNDRREARIERRQDDRRLQQQQQRIERRAQFRDNRDQRREARIERRQDNRQALRQVKGDNRAFRQQFAQRLQGPLASQFVSREMRPMRAVRYDRPIVSVGERFNLAAATTVVPSFYRTEYYDTPQYYYRYDDDLGYLYRVNRGDNLVSSLIPLFGGYGVGDPWPVTYRSSYVPVGYQSLYYDTPDYYYRYDGNGIYQIDAQTQLITALVALLGGNGFGVGQVLPQANYGIYNVPLAYRSSYYDTDDSWYRYGDGYIYQVDPYSYRVENRYPIYANYDSYIVGQQWPVAYPDYNVPYGYRDLYYDTPQYNYRYANGAIYQVDPTSQLITSIVSLLSGQNFAVGQPLPAGYDVYNVPFAYRDRYVDTADDWYRYNDGYVYQVDPYTGLIEDAYPVYA